MNKIDTDKIKQSHNIVDVVARYVPIKKQGKDYFGCCPFHAENSPSFSVSEKDQFFHCFGCGANGDVIKFVQDFSGLEFMEACRELGAEIELMPTKQIKQNIERSYQITSLPSYDKRNHEKAETMINGITPCSQGSYEINSLFYYKVVNFDGELVNLYNPISDKFIAGGVSHLAFTPIKKNETNNYLVIVDFWQGIKIANDTQNNVLVSFSAYNTLLICQHKAEQKRAPVLRYEDTQAEQLCDVGTWVYLDNDGKLYKKNKGEYLDD